MTLGSTVHGTGTPGHIPLGDTMDGMTHGTTEDFMTHGTTVTEDGMADGTAHGTDTCILIMPVGTADGTHTGTTITTTIRDMRSTGMTIGQEADATQVLTVYSQAGFPQEEDRAPQAGSAAQHRPRQAECRQVQHPLQEEGRQPHALHPLRQEQLSAEALQQA